MARTLFILALVLCLAPSVAAQNRDYSIALHAQDSFMGCDDHLRDCWAIVTYMPMPDPRWPEYFIHVMVCGHGWAPGSDGFTAAWYGLTWPEGWMVSWTSCADSTVGTIEHPGDSVEQHWFDCVEPTGYPVIIGILGIIPTSPGEVLVTVHSGLGLALVADCHGTADILLPCDIGNGRAGWVDIGTGDAGCNPCPCVGPPCYSPPSGTDTSTWGMIKALYR